MKIKLKPYPDSSIVYQTNVASKEQGEGKKYYKRFILSSEI